MTATTESSTTYVVQVLCAGPFTTWEYPGCSREEATFASREEAEAAIESLRRVYVDADTFRITDSDGVCEVLASTATADRLIQQSIDEDSMVHAEYTEALALALQIECKDSAETRSDEGDAFILEYWGEYSDAVGSDPVSWRVHLERAD